MQRRRRQSTGGALGQNCCARCPANSVSPYSSASSRRSSGHLRGLHVVQWSPACADLAGQIAISASLDPGLRDSPRQTRRCHSAPPAGEEVGEVWRRVSPPDTSQQVGDAEMQHPPPTGTPRGGFNPADKDISLTAVTRPPSAVFRYVQVETVNTDDSDEIESLAASPCAPGRQCHRHQRRADRNTGMQLAGDIRPARWRSTTPNRPPESATC